MCRATRAGAWGARTRRPYVPLPQAPGRHEAPPHERFTSPPSLTRLTSARFTSRLPADEYQRKRREKLGLPQPDERKRLSAHEKARATGCLAIILDDLDSREGGEGGEGGESGEADEQLPRELKKVRAPPSTRY